MNPTAIFWIGFAVGATTALCVAVSIWNHLRLARALKHAEQALQAQQSAPQPSIQQAQERVNSYDTRKPEKAEPQFSGIGPTDIMNRELYDRQKARLDSTPPFVRPTPDEITQAAREATQNGGGK